MRSLDREVEAPPRRAARPSLRGLVGRISIGMLLIASAINAGCASGHSFNGQSFRGHGLAFDVGPQPESWHPLNVSQGLLAFRDEERDATIVVNGRCGKDGDDVPLSALTQHLFMRFTEREEIESTTFAFDGREALRTVMRAKLDGVKLQFATVVAKKDGCVYDFVLIVRPESFSAIDPEFKRFYSGFHAGPRE